MHCAAARYIPPSDADIWTADPWADAPPPAPARPASPPAATTAPAGDDAFAKIGFTEIPARTPTLTLTILALLAAVFAAELAFAIEPAKGLLEPGVRTLLALGGLQYTATVGSDEWYRMFLAPLMHTGLIHLVINGIALYVAGRLLEPVIGARWFAALFVVSGLAGSMVSLLVNDRNIVSVGASGAIMGLFAAMLVVSGRFANPARLRLRLTAIQVLIASMLPVTSGSLGAVDYGAHLGGAIAGAIVALLMLAVWRETPVSARGAAAAPRLAFIATFIAGLGLAGAAYGATQIPYDHKLQSYGALLFPRDQLPATDKAAKAAAESLIATHPRDPRGHFYRALALIDAKSLASAEGELRIALGDSELLKMMFKPVFTQRMEMLLSLVLLDQHRLSDARQAAQPVCVLTNTFREQVAKYGLCSL